MYWSFSSSQHVQDAVKNAECYRSRVNHGPRFNAKSLQSSNYRPEADVSTEPAPTKVSCYQSLIGVLQCIVELQRGDFAIQVSTMASMIALSHEGYLSAVLQMFYSLNSEHNGFTLFDPTNPEIDQTQFPTERWSETIYGTCKEDTTSNAPMSRGIGLTMRAFVYSEYAGDLFTRYSRTSFTSLFNIAPIFAHSKKKIICETSIFVSEFIAMES